MRGYDSEWYAAHLAREFREKLGRGDHVPDAGNPVEIPELPEAEIQREIAQHILTLGRGIYAVWHRMDMPTTCQVGTPDFVGFYQGRPFAIEVKTKTGKVSNEQRGQLHLSELAGAKTAVVRSRQEAVEFLEGLKR